MNINMIQDKQEKLQPGAIGVFDSGYGGLTILKEIRRILPEYDYIYLGDNARAPYGNRSFEVVHHFTLQAVQYLFLQRMQSGHPGVQHRLGEGSAHYPADIPPYPRTTAPRARRDTPHRGDITRGVA